ncbi:MAG: hypothetical protein ABW173_05815, partial [Sphingomonas sp.]
MIESVHRLRQRMSAVVVHAVSGGIAPAEPAATVTKRLKRMPDTTKQPTLADVDDSRRDGACVRGCRVALKRGGRGEGADQRADLAGAGGTDEAGQERQGRSIDGSRRAAIPAGRRAAPRLDDRDRRMDLHRIARILSIGRIGASRLLAAAAAYVVQVIPYPRSRHFKGFQRARRSVVGWTPALHQRRPGRPRHASVADRSQRRLCPFVGALGQNQWGRSAIAPSPS